MGKTLTKQKWVTRSPSEKSTFMYIKNFRREYSKTGKKLTEVKRKFWKKRSII